MRFPLVHLASPRLLRAALLGVAVALPIPLRAQTVPSPTPGVASPLPSAAPASPAPAPSAAAPAQSYVFVPPSTWQAIPLSAMPLMIRGVIAIWMAPSSDPRGFRPSINIAHESAAANTMSFESVTALERAAIERIAGSGNVKEQFVGACAPGVKNERFVSRLTMGAFSLHVEQIVSVGKAGTYIVTYEYPDGSTPDVLAEGAISAFCAAANPAS
jgi:hypothetical protein